MDEQKFNNAIVLKSVVTQTYDSDLVTHIITNTYTRTGREVFEDLQNELQAHGLIPDEYFISDFTEKLPEDVYFKVSTDFGGNEGIYIDITFFDGNKTQNFATGKSLAETADDFMKMSRIGATMQLLLNGNGKEYELTAEKNVVPQKASPVVDPYKKTIYVCSPLAGEIQANIAKAREYSKFVAEQGGTPIAPHITEIFDDLIPSEREMGLAMGIDYLHKADEIWVFGDRISSGMAAEIEIAQNELHIPIFQIPAPPYEINPYEKREQLNKPVADKTPTLSLQDKLNAAKTSVQKNIDSSHQHNKPNQERN